jgi:hypothetical protein
MAQTREQNSSESGHLCSERNHLQSCDADQTGSIPDGNPSCDKSAGHSGGKVSRDCTRNGQLNRKSCCMIPSFKVFHFLRSLSFKSTIYNIR